MNFKWSQTSTDDAAYGFLTIEHANSSYRFWLTKKEAAKIIEYSMGNMASIIEWFNNFEKFLKENAFQKDADVKKSG